MLTEPAAYDPTTAPAGMPVPEIPIPMMVLSTAGPVIGTVGESVVVVPENTDWRPTSSRGVPVGPPMTREPIPRIFAHSEWRRWLRKHLDPDEFWVMHFEDREQPRMLIRRDPAFFYVPAADFPEDRSGQRQHMEALIAEFLRAIAAKRGAPRPPGSLG